LSLGSLQPQSQRTLVAQRDPLLDALLHVLGAPLQLLGWITDALFLTVRALFDQFGIPIVLLSGLAEATFAVGLVFPGVVIMFLAGAQSAGDPGRLLAVFAAAVGGTVLGDTISYALGRWGGHYLLRSRWGPSVRVGSALVRGRARWFIPLYHLYSVTRALGPFGAGAVRMPVWSWLPLDYVGAAVANAIWVGSGAVLGTAVLTPDGRLQQHPLLRIGLAVLGVAWFLLFRNIVQRRMRELATVPAAAAEPPAPPR
jgi:membrane protein DedA with SNARE-associated domain